MLYPMILDPVFKDYIWGGEKLKKIYGKVSGFDNIAESWELACHKDGVSIIKNGEYKGMPLDGYLKQQGNSVFGTNSNGNTELPLLIKFIDARDSLSIQVHPNEEYARKVEGQSGKTELWYIIDCAK